MESKEENVCLDQIDLLKGEINAAMLAIAGNALRPLQESLWRQEVLCVSLKRLLQLLRGTNCKPDAIDRIRAATAALHRLNQTYAIVIQQSSASTDILYNLCRSYKESSYNEAGRSSYASRTFEG